MEQEQRRTLTMEEVAALLTVGVPTVQSLLNRGVLRAQREGDQVCVLYEDVVAFLRSDKRVLLDDSSGPSDQGLLG